MGEKVLWAAPGSRGTTGPYQIERVAGAESYTLCDNNGDSVNGGVAVPESQLMSA